MTLCAWSKVVFQLPSCCFKPIWNRRNLWLAYFMHNVSSAYILIVPAKARTSLRLLSSDSDNEGWSDLAKDLGFGFVVLERLLQVRRGTMRDIRKNFDWLSKNTRAITDGWVYKAAQVLQHPICHTCLGNVWNIWVHKKIYICFVFLWIVFAYTKRDIVSTPTQESEGL